MPAPKATVNATRIWVSGAEHGDFGRNAPTDGNITISTAHPRTGSNAYRVNAASGVKSTWNVDSSDTKTNIFISFFRAYLYIVTLPASTRAIWCRGAVSLGATLPGLRLRSTGILEFHDGTNVLAAGSQALSTGQYYMIEIGMNSTDDQLSLRIDGVTDIDWTTVGNMAAFSFIVLGAVDTVAATFDLHWDDIEIDSENWCGSGRVKRMTVTGAGTSTDAGFTIGGSSPAATKWESLTEVSTDDGVTYVLTDVTSGDFETYLFDDIPGDCVQVRGLMFRMRFKRDGGTNGNVNIRTKLFGHFDDGGTVASTSAWQWVENTMHSAAIGRSTPIGGQWTNERVNALEIGIRTNSVNPSDISSLAVEIGYDDTTGALVSINRHSATGWEAGDATAEGTIVGTAAAATNVAKTGTYSLRVNPAGSTASYIRQDISLTSQREGYAYCWVYVTTRPVAGQKMRLLTFASTASLNGAVLMDSDGKIQLEDRNGVIGSLSTLAIPLTTWTRIDFKFRCSTSTTAGDGAGEVLVGGSSYCSSAAMNSNNTTYTHINWGTSLAPGASGCDVNYDDCVVDTTSWIDAADLIRVVDILSTAAGSLTGAGFSANGAANEWDCLDDTPTDGDTTYVGMGTTNPANGSYVTQNVTSDAGAIRSVTLLASFKRDGASNGSGGPSLRNNGHNGDVASVTITGAYAWNRVIKRRSDYDGSWTLALINSAELVIRNTSANPSRCSNLRATVEYVEYIPPAAVGHSQVVIVG